MGVDTVVYTDNHFFERDVDYTLAKLCSLLGNNLHIVGDFKGGDMSKDPEMLNITVDMYHSVKEKWETEHCVGIITDKLECNIQKQVIFFYDFNWDFGRWWSFADSFKEGADTKLTEHYRRQLDRIKFCGELFGATKMILFNDQDHQDIEGMTIEEVLKEPRWLVVRGPEVKDNDNNDDQRLWSSNYLYYEEWTDNSDFDLEKWKLEYL
jgi:hypothetical protein